MNEQSLKYPIGQFETPEIISVEVLDEWISSIESFPLKLENEVMNLSDKELDYKYRKGGWNIRQLIHHCADSHINSFVRFKLALTEDTPTIKPYFEDRWAELPDVKDSPIKYSLEILNGLHARWSILLKILEEDDLLREFFHPESNKIISLRENIGIYAWHCKHHLEHVRLAKRNKY